jgi:uncharacterized protein YoxC
MLNIQGLKNCLLVLLLSFLFTKVYADAARDSILRQLDEAIQNKAVYTGAREQRIASLHRNEASLPPFEYYNALYNEYRKLNLDSAIRYVKKGLALAEATGNIQHQQLTTLRLATLYSSLGKYRESEQLLTGIHKKDLPPALYADYYEACMRFYEHYATYSYTDAYMQQISRYRDSLLQTLPPSDIGWKVNRAEQQIHSGQATEAEKELLAALPTVKQEHYAYAMITYLLGNINRQRHDTVAEMRWYALSALSDTRNAVRDHASLLNLALLCYATGDVDRAYRYTHSAIEDALSARVQFRNRQMAEFLSVVSTAYQEREALRRQQLQHYLLAISLLSFFLLAAVVYVYRQMKKMQRLKEEIDAGSKQLALLNKDISQKNAELLERNNQLSEANHIKEEYIARFFDLCSAYINKLENYRKTLNQKATGKKMDELFEMLRSTTLVDTELEELYRHFDHIFLHLYPDFVRHFNRLLVPEEQVVLKQGELLNTELRIFALIRLGITDSNKIAAFLRYSVSTIYNYRTKARNKAAVPRDEFEKMVMEAGISGEKTL